VPSLYSASVDVVNQMLQVTRIGYRSAVSLSSPMLQITADVPMSNIIIGLTLINAVIKILKMHSVVPQLAISNFCLSYIKIYVFTALLRLTTVLAHPKITAWSPM